METNEKSPLFCINYSIDIEKVIFVYRLMAEKRNALAKTNQDIEDATKQLEAAKEVPKIVQYVPIR